MKTTEVDMIDAAKIKSLAGRLLGSASSIDNPLFLGDIAVVSSDLPLKPRRDICRFRLQEADGVHLLRGYAVTDEKLGPTPDHWRNLQASQELLKAQLYLLLAGSVLGDPVGWASQQDGHIIQHLVPTKSHEGLHVSSSCSARLTWHTEDAFHPCSGDYIALMCLRNPGQTITWVADIANALPGADEVIDVLFKARFRIPPDESHREASRGPKTKAPPPSETFDSESPTQNRLVDENREICVLFGDPRSPYVRLDAHFIDRSSAGTLAHAALEDLLRRFDDVAEGIVLRPGDILFLNNATAVHARDSFEALYDGRDRWMQRLSLTRDLKRSISYRRMPGSRVIGLKASPPSINSS